MAIETQSTPSTDTKTLICPRCGTPRPGANIACNQRTCRPAALRRVSLIPLIR